jgi:hypothetical protein
MQSGFEICSIIFVATTGWLPTSKNKIKKVVHKLSKSCQKMSKNCQKVVKVVKKLSQILLHQEKKKKK